ncbi:GerAB/ArcD/ProY family transporter [Salipaludibacillus aurantiacus]|uniref:Spore germination protein (Amino acid permease) n=1 Tax=Salipaludibacillus aurantiacus TaxID=1601833 RepID=A0A1H9RGR0_9BACI|nr:GerAB/ArcD/ProY family transporter [Salipaludibacillus aurantiacus]SER71908.1 spore germination protein (amino acid permease) [Salipaludibacillus aurantiacus]
MEPLLNNRISANQIFFLIVQTQIGIAVLTLPARVFAEAEWEGWISILITGGIIQSLLILYISLIHRFKDHTFFTMTRILIGKPLSILVNFLYFLYFLTVTILILTLYYRTIASWLFPETPKWIIMALIVSAAVFLVREDIHIIARFYTLVSGLLILIIGVQFTGYTAAHPLYLLPLGHISLADYLKGADASLQSMLGFELILFIYPFIQAAKKDITKVSSYAIWFTTFVYVFTSITAYLFFSPDEIVLVPNPVLYMLKAFSSPVIDRLDLIFISVWIISVTTSLMTYLFLASQYTQVIFSLKKRKSTVFYLGVLILSIALFFESNEAIDTLSEFVGSVSYTFIVFIPVILLITALIRKKPARGKEKAS